MAYGILGSTTLHPLRLHPRHHPSSHSAHQRGSERLGEIYKDRLARQFCAHGIGTSTPSLPNFLHSLIRFAGVDILPIFCLQSHERFWISFPPSPGLGPLSSMLGLIATLCLGRISSGRTDPAHDLFHEATTESGPLWAVSLYRRCILTGELHCSHDSWSKLMACQLYMQPVYLHVTRGLDGSQTGLLLLPSSVAGSASSLHAGWHMRVSQTLFSVMAVSLMLSKHFKEYKKAQAFFSIIPWLQAISIIIGWGPTTSLTQLWSEMAVAAIGGGFIITSLLSES